MRLKNHTVDREAAGGAGPWCVMQAMDVREGKRIYGRTGNSRAEAHHAGPGSGGGFGFGGALCGGYAGSGSCSGRLSLKVLNPVFAAFSFPVCDEGCARDNHTAAHPGPDFRLFSEHGQPQNGRPDKL